nr:DnaJ domain-containing protein [Campylobacter sp.]
MNLLLFIGAIIGVYYLITSGYLKDPYQYTRKKKQFELQDAKFLVALLAKVAKANGKVSQEEANYVSNMLDLICDELGTDIYRNELKIVYNFHKDSPKKVFDIAVEYRFARRLTKQESISVVIYLLNLAYIDGKFDDMERVAINEVCDGLDLDSITKRNLFIQFDREFKEQQSNGTWEQTNQTKSRRKQRVKPVFTHKDPYQVLELSPDASFDEIKKQYRKLARKYHPDFLGSNADKSVISEATKKLQEINEAYESLKNKFEK